MTSVIGPVLVVDWVLLRSVRSALDQASDQLAELRPERPLADAAASIAQSEMETACRATMTAVAEQMTLHVNDVRAYAETLEDAASRYQSTAESAASAIASGRAVPTLSR